MGKNPFDYKTMEKILFSVYMPEAENKRRARKYLRKMAQHIEHGYEIGYRDGKAGKRLISKGELFNLTDENPLLRRMLFLAYTAYQSGWQAGKGGK